MKEFLTCLGDLFGWAVILCLVFLSGAVFGQNQSGPDKPTNPVSESTATQVTPTPSAPITPTAPAQPKTETPVDTQVNTQPQDGKEAVVSKNGITSKDISNLIDSLLSDDPMAVKDVRDELKEIGRPAVPFLIKALESSKPEKRYLICEILGEIRDISSVGALVNLLNDQDEHTASVASAAARALRNCADLSVIPHLIKVVTSTDIDLRYEAVKTLGVLRAYQSLPVIRRLITDTAKTSLGYQVKTAVVQAIGRLKDNSSVKNLIPLLKNSDFDASDEPFVKYVIKALEQITNYRPGSFSRTDDKKKEVVVKKWDEWWEKNKNNKGYE
jgi:hypothetical protein